MASAMQRSMSYRKPVPEYIPSPPSSPLHESDPVAQEPEKDLPPLPQNWREVVAAKIMQASSDTTHTSLSSSQNPLYVGIEKPYVVKHEAWLNSMQFCGQ
ncbi:hypothetical protein CVT26_005239 [Gymnopilus dilepis]|uniref:Uncharacterized protein n=1 Tax=Gymnopilus dilepis TaxID=231916 RepID=A0A409YVP1_9AGAR|nr:hypothetical protein CVT26_005239 [Gymnopilus dilepis]